MNKKDVFSISNVFDKIRKNETKEKFFYEAAMEALSSKLSTARFLQPTRLPAYLRPFRSKVPNQQYYSIMHNVYHKHI